FSQLMITSSNGFTYYTYEYQNLISGSTSGAELGTQSQIAHCWRLNVNYSFLNSDFAANGPTSNISDSGSVQTYEDSSPKHMVTVQSMFNLPEKFHLDQTYRFITALPAQKVSAYQTMDVRLERALARNLSLELVGQNLFQHVHGEWGTGDPTQPVVGVYRTGYVRLAVHSGQP
ncbi:MAG: outer membrane beta-barrel protein, partial [Terracidiphilus sp.]